MKVISSLFVISIFLFSCSEKVENFDLKKSVTSFLSNNQSIAVFGKLDLKSLLTKADYEKIPKFGFILSSVMNEFNSTLKLESSIYYAAEGPFSQKGIPSSLYAFFEVSNSDSLVKQLIKKGYDFDQKGKIQIAEFGKLSLGIKNGLAILVYKEADYDASIVLTKSFEESSRNYNGSDFYKMLSAKGDFLLTLSLEALYKTSSTELSKLDSDKKAEIAKMVSKSYLQTSFKFEDGQAILETKNYFSKALKENLFFKTDASASVLKKLGHGSPKVGFTMNLDMVKIQQFLNDYAPDALTKLGNDVGGTFQMILMMGGDNSLSGLFSGELGFVLLGEVANEGSMTPDFNVYLGLGAKGKPLAEMARPFLSHGSIVANIDSQSISVFTSSVYSPDKSKSLILPFDYDKFGKKSISCFVYLDGMDMSTFELEGGYKVLNIVKSVTFDLDENGSELMIKSKDSQGNILNQAIKFFLKEYETEISSLSI